MQPVHCTSDGPWVPQRLGDERTDAGAYVWSTLLDSGAVLVSGTDAPVEDVDPIANFYSAVTRILGDTDGDGELDAFYPEQAMTRVEALRSMTRDAAWSVFQDDAVGSLEEGKLADLVVLSQNLLDAPDDAIPATTVDLTIVGGQVVHRR
jgi:predicted amidohydrolase YtcJ